METTVLIDAVLLERARELTGMQDNSVLVEKGLESLIAREAGKRLAALGGTDPDLRSVRRRRSALARPLRRDE